MFLLKILLLLVLSAGAVVSIFDPYTAVKTKSYHRDPHIGRELRRHQHHHPDYHSRLSDGRYQQSQPLEQHERHANNGHSGRDYANNIDDFYGGCPSGFTGLLAYPYDCRRFLNCWKGRAYIQTCGPGTVFNGETLECDNPEKVVCLGISDAPKRNQEPQNHRLGRLHTVHPDDDVSCPSTFSGLLPHPHDCSKFLNCASGVMHIQSCGPQTMFNPIMKVCDFAHKVDCSGRGGSAGSSSSPPSLPTVNANRGAKTFETITRENQAGNQNVPHRSGGPPLHHHHHHHHLHRHDVHGAHPSHVSPTGNIHRDLDCTEAHHQIHQSPAPTASQTPIFHRDRWANMNRTRPSPPGETPSWQTPKTPTTPDRSWTRTTVTNSNWAPTPVPSTTPQPPRPAYGSSSSSWTQTSPIRPSSNYPNTNYDNSLNRTRTDSHTTSTTNIYYAQPVDDDRPSEEVFSNIDGGDISEIYLPSSRHNASRGVYFPPSNQDPRPSHPSMDAINIPSANLMPPHQFSPTDDRQFQVHDQSPDFSSPHPSYTPPRYNPGFGHFNGTTTVYMSPSRGNHYPSIDAINIPVSQSPSDRRSPPNYPNPDPEPPQSGSRRWDDGYPSPHDTSMDTINIPSINLMPPHRDPPNWPPVSEPDDGQAQLPEYGPFNATSFFISPPEPAPNPEPTWFTNDESNLFGGLLPPMPTAPQPPGRESHSPLPPPTTPTPPIGPLYISSTTPTPPGKTNVRTFQIYPPPSIQNATTKVHPYPFYTPPYSGVAHSRNTSWSQWPAVKTAPSTVQTRLLGPDDNREPDIIFNHEDGVVVPSKLHPMMSPTTPERRGVSPPNYNREFYKQTTPSSGRRASDHTDTSDEIGQLAVSEAIRLLLRPYFNRSGTVTDDMAAKAESHIMNLARSAEPSSTSTSPPPSAEIHKDVEIVFAGEQNSLSPNPDHPTHTHVHQPSKYHHRHHDRNFHSRNPHIPNPYENELEGGPEPRHEGTTPRTRIQVSTSTTEASPDLDVCEFDCGNGQCVEAVETCDGVDNCGNRRDEQNCDHLGYQLRLSGQGAGRIEVKIQGRWGYICDDKFGIQDANVACRELGFPLGASAVHGNSFYPPTEGEGVAFFMDEVECLGNETSLKDCKFMGWGLSDCGSDEVVGVECKTPTMKCPNDYWLCRTSDECIHPSFVCDNVPDCSDKSDESNAVCNSTVEFRLKGGTGKMEGRLEVLYHGVWGTVCDDDFGQTEAQVACNSLGYYGQAKIVKNAFGPGSGPIWLDQVSCFGNESSIDKCNHWSWAEHNCNHTEDVSLKCAAGAHPRSSSTAPKSRQQSKFDEQPKTLDDIGMDYYFMERSSKLANTRGKVCGHFNGNLTEDVPRELERVVNGNVAKRGHHPWQATIRTKGHGGVSKHWCGAVLISKKHLLTAAHCLVGYSKGAYFIRLGDHYANIAESSEVDSFIENWYIHEKFREGTHMNNDIAVIVMKNSVRFNDYIQPICLPSKETSYKVGRECTISGWGSIQSGVSTPSNNLRVAQIPIISDDICKLPHVYGNSITEGMFCAGFLEEGIDACEGDSGGPFVCSDSDAGTLYGIISWGQHCGHANKPGVYVKVEKYLDWIYEKIRFSMQQTN